MLALWEQGCSGLKTPDWTTSDQMTRETRVTELNVMKLPKRENVVVNFPKNGRNVSAYFPILHNFFRLEANAAVHKRICLLFIF